MARTKDPHAATVKAWQTRARAADSGGVVQQRGDFSGTGPSITGYHGSQERWGDSPTEMFRIGDKGTLDSIGVWFTTDKRLAARFGEQIGYDRAKGNEEKFGSLHEGSVEFKHPLVLETPKWLVEMAHVEDMSYSNWKQNGGRGDDSWDQFASLMESVTGEKMNSTKIAAKAREWLLSRGYDGIVLRNTAADSGFLDREVGGRPNFSTYFIALDPKNVRRKRIR